MSKPGIRTPRRKPLEDSQRHHRVNFILQSYKFFAVWQYFRLTFNR